jgi:YtcA family
MTRCGPSRRWRPWAGLVLALLLLPSCSHAPSFDILGSFFPACLVCVVVAILVTVLARWILSRLHYELALPVLVYPSLRLSSRLRQRRPSCWRERLRFWMIPCCDCCGSLGYCL